MVCVVQICRQLSSRTRKELQFHPGPARKLGCTVPVWDIALMRVQWINSWWWTEELSEICRVSCQNKFVKFVHLVGFIIKQKGCIYSYVAYLCHCCNNKSHTSNSGSGKESSIINEYVQNCGLPPAETTTFTERRASSEQLQFVPQLLQLVFYVHGTMHRASLDMEIICNQQDATFNALYWQQRCTCFGRFSPIVRSSETMCAAYGTDMLIYGMIGSTNL